MNKIKIFLLTFTAIFWSLLANANEPLLDSAKANYDNGAFSMAIEQYEAILSKGLNSSNLRFNLGNSYYRNGQLGLSILNFEKAIKLDPSNENAQFNLELANTKTSDKFDAVPQVSLNKILIGINNSVNYNLISIIGILLILLATLGFLYGKKKRIKKSINYARITVALGLIVTLIGWQQKSAVNEFKAGIIISQGVNVFSEPNPSSTLLFEVHEGTKLEVLSESDEWINVKAPNNEIGWINKSGFQTI